MYANGDVLLEDFEPGTITDELTLPAGDYELGAEGAGDDQWVLQVRPDRLPDHGDDSIETWLIAPGTGAMVSLGPVPTQGLGAATVELTVPRGLDVGTFTLVDVSAEPLDGDPTHSGASLARGSLST